jgi:hypothetical protein
VARLSGLDLSRLRCLLDLLVGSDTGSEASENGWERGQEPVGMGDQASYYRGMPWGMGARSDLIPKPSGKWGQPGSCYRSYRRSRSAYNPLTLPWCPPFSPLCTPSAACAVASKGNASVCTCAPYRRILRCRSGGRPNRVAIEREASGVERPERPATPRLSPTAKAE